MTRAVIVGVALAMAVMPLSACGGGQTYRPPVWPAAGPGAIVLTWNDDEQSRQVDVGQEVDVRLATDPCTVTSIPTPDDPAVIASEQAGTVSGSVWARFRAVGKGSTNITALHKPSCKWRPGASLPARRFVVTVIVQ
jgi:hypothetical protein